MRLHLIILAALIAVPAIETFENCKKFCEKGKDADSEYCLTLKFFNCHIMIPRCEVKEIQCNYKKQGSGPSKFDSIFHKNCTVTPPCDDSSSSEET